MPFHSVISVFFYPCLSSLYYSIQSLKMEEDEELNSLLDCDLPNNDVEAESSQRVSQQLISSPKLRRMLLC